MIAEFDGCFGLGGCVWQEISWNLSSSNCILDASSESIRSLFYLSVYFELAFILSLRGNVSLDVSTLTEREIKDFHQNHLQT